MKTLNNIVLKSLENDFPFVLYKKPNSNVIDLRVLETAHEQLNIPVCAIGGINLSNVQELLNHKPDMISVISDIWSTDDIKQQAQNYTKLF